MNLLGIFKNKEKKANNTDVFIPVSAENRIKIIEMKEQGYRSEEIAVDLDLPVEKVYNIWKVEQAKRRRPEQQQEKSDQQKIKDEIELQKLNNSLEQLKLDAEIKRLDLELKRQEAKADADARKAELLAELSGNGGNNWDRVLGYVLDRLDNDPRNPRNHGAQQSNFAQSSAQNSFVIDHTQSAPITETPSTPAPPTPPIDYSKEFTEDEIYQFLDAQSDALINQAKLLSYEMLKSEVLKRNPTMNIKNIDRAYAILHDGVYC